MLNNEHKLGNIYFLLTKYSKIMDILSILNEKKVMAALCLLLYWWPSFVAKDALILNHFYLPYLATLQWKNIIVLFLNATLQH